MVSPVDILAEKARRAQARAHAVGGPGAMACSLSSGRWRWAPHLRLLSGLLAKAATTAGRRIIIDMPPRHGKSELASHWFPAWLLSIDPTKRIILAGYEADFAAGWGRKVRNTLTENKDRLSVRLAPDSAAANRWETTQGGGMVTAGVGGPINGRAADVLLIDDPIKNAEEADSQLVRDRTWEWWTSTAYTRLEPGASAVVIMTRWHEDDLVGRLRTAQKDGGEAWEVVELPALAELGGDALGRQIGEPLWPERYDVAELAKIKSAVGSRVWTSLYQQRPSPETGAIWQRDWWKFWRHPWEAESTDPRIRARTVLVPTRWDEQFLSWDLALKNTSGADLVAGGAWGVAGRGRYLLDLDWERMTFVQTLAAIQAQASTWPEALAKLIEDAANGPAAISSLQGKVDGIIAVKPRGSKRARGAAVAPLIESGCVYLPLHASWLGAYLDETSAFPNGAHDDAFDMTSQALDHTLHRDYAEPPPDAPVGSEAWVDEQEEERVYQAQLRKRRGGSW